MTVSPSVPPTSRVAPPVKPSPPTPRIRVPKAGDVLPVGDASQTRPAPVVSLTSPERAPLVAHCAHPIPGGTSTPPMLASRTTVCEFIDVLLSVVTRRQRWVISFARAAEDAHACVSIHEDQEWAES